MQTLLYRIRILKIQQFKITAHNAITNHFRRPAFLRLPIRIKRFLHARAAVGAMRTLKAAAEAGMAVIAITIAIARHLVNNRTCFGSSFVRCDMGRSNQAGFCQLFLRENRRQRSAWFGSGRMERRNLGCLVYKLCMRHASGQKNGKHTYKMLHVMIILLQNRSLK
jgi:hypothetical protein